MWLFYRQRWPEIQTRVGGAPLVPLRYVGGMDRVCTTCHAIRGAETEGDWCPACGGALTDRLVMKEQKQPGRPPAEVDHRGIVLPRRHALGGVITPQ